MEQHVVLQVNVLLQVVLQLGQAGVQGSPCIAGALGQGQFEGEVVNSGERITVIVMLAAHDRYRPCGHAGDSARYHRKQDLFFLLHVCFKFGLHAL